MSARVNLVWIDRSAQGPRPRARVGVTVERMPVVSSIFAVTLSMVVGFNALLMTALAGIPARPLSG